MDLYVINPIRCLSHRTGGGGVILALPNRTVFFSRSLVFANWLGKWWLGSDVGQQKLMVKWSKNRAGKRLRHFEPLDLAGKKGYEMAMGVGRERGSFSIYE